MNEFDRFRIDESKEWLKMVSELNGRIKTCDNMLEVVDRLGGVRGIDYSKPHIKASTKTDAMDDVIVAIEELKGKWRDEKLRIKAELDEATKTIYKIPVSTYCDVLILRYLECMPWEKVAEETGYGVDNCHKIHKKALLELYRYLPDGWKTKIPKAIE